MHSTKVSCRRAEGGGRSRSRRVALQYPRVVVRLSIPGDSKIWHGDHGQALRFPPSTPTTNRRKTSFANFSLSILLFPFLSNFFLLIWNRGKNPRGRQCLRACTRQRFVTYSQWCGSKTGDHQTNYSRDRSIKPCTCCSNTNSSPEYTECLPLFLCVSLFCVFIVWNYCKFSFWAARSMATEVHPSRRDKRASYSGRRALQHSG